jgi:serine/threonine protein kinase
MTLAAGTRLGPYEIAAQIGEGGMGEVWVARQAEPVKRRVAVKFIRVERGNSRTILSRFEAERQAIALTNHPHIARLLRDRKDSNISERRIGRQTRKQATACTD